MASWACLHYENKEETGLKIQNKLLFVDLKKINVKEVTGLCWQGSLWSVREMNIHSGVWSLMSLPQASDSECWLHLSLTWCATGWHFRSRVHLPLLLLGEQIQFIGHRWVTIRGSQMIPKLVIRGVSEWTGWIWLVILGEYKSFPIASFFQDSARTLFSVNCSDNFAQELSVFQEYHEPHLPWW